MKKCGGVCGEVLPEDRFRWKNKERGWLQSKCIECNKAYQRQHYIENKQDYVDKAKLYVKVYKDVVYTYILNYFLANPCVDCGESDVVVLEFDHVRGKKEANVSELIQSKVGLDRIKEEIAKCDVRCCNCHRRKTSRDKNDWWYRYTQGAELGSTGE